jgi:tetratricopeptide (TPR) repeat protein
MDPQAPPSPLPLWKRVLFSATIGVGFFVILEVVLALAGVPTRLAREDPFWGFSGLVPVFERDGDAYRTRFTEPNRVFNDQRFAAEKPANGLRIFTLGGSSAYGYPWSADSAFSGVLGDVLAEALPERRVESINAAGISYALHRLRFVAREVVEYAPDVLILYSGHNEFIEPDFFAELKKRTPELNRLLALLWRWRLYSGLQSLASSLSAEDRERASAARFDMFVRRNETAAYDAAQKQAIVDAFRDGLREIAALAREHGAHLVLAPVPANLRDWRPVRSVVFEELGDAERREWSAALAAGQRQLAGGRPQQAAAALEQAAHLAPSYAETWFLLGRAYEGLERWDDARAAYARAADLDASPVRRISGTNDAMRAVAAEQGALLVDAERLFEEHSEHGLVGFNWIEDYVHPTREGHALIAWRLWQAMAEAGWLGEQPARREVFERVVAGRRSEGSEHNAVWLFNQASVLRHQGHLEQAAARYREAVALRPDYAPAQAGLGLALQLRGDYAAALVHHERALALGLDTAESRTNLGTTLFAMGRSVEALGHLQRAVELDPGFAPAQTNLGALLEARGEAARAAAHYRRAVEINPAGVEPVNNLAWILATAHDPAVRDGAESVRRAEEAARLTEQRSPQVLDTLAAAYAEAGRFDDAVRAADLAIQLLGDSPEAVPIAERRDGYRAGRPYRSPAAH